jgi:hypothetical protein
MQLKEFLEISLLEKIRNIWIFSDKKWLLIAAIAIYRSINFALAWIDEIFYPDINSSLYTRVKIIVFAFSPLAACAFALFGSRTRINKIVLSLIVFEYVINRFVNFLDSRERRIPEFIEPLFAWDKVGWIYFSLLAVMSTALILVMVFVFLRILQIAIQSLRSFIKWPR